MESALRVFDRRHPGEKEVTFFSDWAAAIFYDRLSQFVTRPIHQGVIAHFRQNHQCAPKTRVLDVGCGTGHYAQLFAGTDYVGLDVSYHRVRLAHNRHSQWNYVCQSAGFLGFHENSFDTVFCTNMIHHLEDSIFKSMLREIYRVAKRGGQLIIYDIFKQPGQDWMTRFAHWADRGDQIRPLEKIQKVFKEALPDHKMFFFRNKILDFYNVFLIK